MFCKNNDLRAMHNSCRESELYDVKTSVKGRLVAFRTPSGLGY